MGAQRAAKRGIDGDVLAHVRGARLVEAQPAVRRGNLEPEQIQVRRLLQQRPGERPVVGVEAGFVRQHLVAHELGCRLAEEPLLVGEVFAREELVRIERAKKKRPTAQYLVHLRHNRLPLWLRPAVVSVVSDVGVVPVPTRER